MMYFTGDTHGNIDSHKLSVKAWPDQKDLRKGDYLIILGDFGGVWDGAANDNWLLHWYNDKSFTTLFIPGNHENYELLRSYPIEEWNGGKIRRIRSSVIMLERGEVFDIDGKSVFCMGGAKSHDMWCRKEGISWWKEELPSDEEYKSAIENLAKHDYSVDYVLTHCCPSSIQDVLGNGLYTHDDLTNFLEHQVKHVVNYRFWMFGHYHIDQMIGDREFAMYNNIINENDIDAYLHSKRLN